MCARPDSQYEGPNLCFCWQAPYFEGFADLVDQCKIDRNRRKFALTLLRERVAREKSIVLSSGQDSASIFSVLARSRTFPGALFRCTEAALGTLQPFWDAPETCRDAPETPSASCWPTRGVPRGSRYQICIDFGCPGASPWTNFE